jgi:hypothetical protein
MAKRKLQWRTPVVLTSDEQKAKCPHCKSEDVEIVWSCIYNYRPKKVLNKRRMDYSDCECVRHGSGKCGKCGIRFPVDRKWLKSKEELEREKKAAKGG